LVNTFPNKKECPEYCFCISPVWRPTEESTHSDIV
jgi:hypothetical protein